MSEIGGGLPRGGRLLWSAARSREKAAAILPIVACHSSASIRKRCMISSYICPSAGVPGSRFNATGGSDAIGRPRLSKRVFFGAEFHDAFHGACRADPRRQSWDRHTENDMPKVIGATVLVAALLTTIGSAPAFDDSKYPDLKGQWHRTDAGGQRGGLQFDPSKPPGRGQEAPLTAEYQAIFEANLADQAAGGQGTDPTFTCLSPGHAPHHECLCTDGNRRHPGNHVYFDGAHS